jgi:hypothetical protein
MNRALGGQILMLEGFISNLEALYFIKLLTERKWIQHVAEIGFNGGHSSYIFLKSRADIVVTSFDLGAHRYVKKAKQFIDQQFPGRHTLILGDSLKTVPEFTNGNPEVRFDLLFVDGGHSYANAFADLHNLEPVSHANSIVMMDDLLPWEPWGIGPFQVWSEAVAQGYVRQSELVRNGVPIQDVKGAKGDKIWGVGSYSSRDSAKLP